MTAEELKSWRERHRLSMQKASEALGCAKNSILNWERGQTIPLYIALACAASTSEDERVAALVALGKIGTQPAFFAVLQAVGEKSPRTNRIAAAALASMNYPAADDELLAMLKGDSSPAKVLAIKAVVVRQIPGASGILIDAITGSDAAAAKEAVKSLYFIATIDDLRVLCTRAAAAEDAAQKKSLSGLASKLATRLDTDEARELVAALK